MAGLILILMAVKKISDEFKEKMIFDKYLVSFMMEVMVFIGIMFLIVSISGYRFFIDITKNGNAASHDIYPSKWLGLSSFLLVVLEVISKIYLKISYDIITKHTNIDKFRKAGFFYVIALLIYVIAFGFSFLIRIMPSAIHLKHAIFIAYVGFGVLDFSILVVGAIYEIMAYFSLPENVQME